MKLFTKEINDKLFAQYKKGSNLAEQYVVAKIFNPYGNGRWYLINSDPNDPDYIWAIVQMGNVVEVGSVSRHELESARLTRYNLHLERDLSFSQEKAETVLEGLRHGMFFKHGGKVHKDGEVVYDEMEFEEYARGGAAISKDRKYTSQQSWEQSYGRKSPTLTYGEGRYDGGGIVDANLFDKLKRGDKITITFNRGAKESTEKKLLIKSKNLVGKGKSWEAEKITFENIDNPSGVKYYAYKRKSGFIGFAIDDMPIYDVKIKNEAVMADGGMMAHGGILKEEDFVWNSLGKKLIVDKVTKDEYYLSSFGQFGSSPFSKKKVEDYIKKGIWTLKPNYARGGSFDEGVKAIEKRLEGTKVSPKYQKKYGKTYNKKEAHEAATSIKGAMRSKYGM